MTSMTPFPWSDLAIILALVLLNGVFAMSELAIVSASRNRLSSLADRGSKGAKAAVRLSNDPGKFLSTVQIGITLIGIINGAYSGASLGGPVAERIILLGVDPELAQTLGFGAVIGITTYLSLVIGELVPKQIALGAPEKFAAIIALPMEWLARLTAPIVWLLDNSSALIFRMIGLRRDSRKALSAEELQMIFAEAHQSGVIEEHERAVISGVVRLADRPVREVMTPRTDIDWLPANATAADVRSKLLESSHTRLPVAEESIDNILGVVQARDIVSAQFRGQPIDLRQLMRRAEIVPDQLDAMDALEILRKAEVPMVLVHDEYGHFEGIVTPNDLLSSIAGEFESDKEDGDTPSIIERKDGSLLVSGALPADSLAERLDIDLPEDRDYATAAGHALYILRHLPEEGEIFEDQGWRFEVIDMDGRKIDKLLVSLME
ncbi:MAG: hemolysin family protein [Novosphingopyxis baekryungensis]|nr:hemolysin family protein [Novosphingopyxis baekryungensis]